MKNCLRKLLPIVIVVFFTSCASSYKAISPSTLEYPAIEKETGFSYKFNVLQKAGNRKLAKLLIAATANKRFREEFSGNSIVDREIKIGETFYGLMAIDDNGFMPLSLQMIP